MIRPANFALFSLGFFSLHLLLCAVPALGETPGEDRSKDFAVRVPAELVDDFSGILSRGSFQRWIVGNDSSFTLEVGHDADASNLVYASLLPVPQELQNLLDDAPVGFGEDFVALGETTYRASDLAFAFRTTTDDRPSVLVIGNDLDRVARLVDRVISTAARPQWWSDLAGQDYVVWEHQHQQRSGVWTKIDQEIRLDPEERDDFAARAAAYQELEESRGDQILVRAPGRAHHLAQALDGVAAITASQLGVSLRPRPEVIVEPDFVAQGRRLAKIGAAVIAEVDGVERLHIVEHPDDVQHYRHAAARLVLRRAGFDPPPLLEAGAALWISRKWYGRSWDDWLADFAYAGVFPEPHELLAREPEGSSSDVLWTPIAAAVIDRVPGENLRVKMERLRDGYDIASLLRAVEEDALAASVKSKMPIRNAALKKTFLNGISFAMANGLEIGYHAPGVVPQLDRLSKLGSNSVSLMPFAYQPRPDEPEFTFLNRRPSSETDVGVIHSARRAHEQGMTVLWKPHVWISFDSWPGDVEMKNDADWQAWWRHYRRYVMHHAVLAQSTESELFSIGVELGKTLVREDDWRRLISSVRRVYDGAVTYAGNWWGDYENVTFWDDLDFIGVDAYFPLAHEDAADRAALIEGARSAKEQVEAIAKKWDRPVLFTEVGFSARRGAWVSPHEEGGEVDEEHQRLAYDVLFSELGRPPWLRGVFVWKAFSHADAEDRDRPDFRFLGRPAEAVVGNYFQSDRSERPIGR